MRAWDAGFERVENPDDVLPAAVSSRIRQATGLPSAHDLVRPQYWMSALAVDQNELRNILKAAGLTWKKSAKTLPKGSIRVLKRHSRGTSLLETPPVIEERIVPTVERIPEPDLEWVTIGRTDAGTYLTADDVRQVHFALAEDFARDDDPIIPAGVRDETLLESALLRQHTQSGEHVKYATAEMVSAALLHSLVLNHAFYNGNKRTALVSMLVLLDANGLLVTSSEEQLFRLVLRVARHGIVPMPATQLADREVLWISAWIVENSRPVEKGERPIQWRRLKKILTDFGCEWSMANVGNRINVTRVLPSEGRWSRPRVLTSQVKYTDDGREAMRYTIHEIRTRLELDEEHGVDSASFYGTEDYAVDDFIVHYRKLLKRLSKL